MKIKDAYLNDGQLDDAVDPFDMATQRERDLWSAIAALRSVAANEDQDTIPSQGLVFDCRKMIRTLESFLQDYKHD